MIYVHLPLLSNNIIQVTQNMLFHMHCVMQVKQQQEQEGAVTEEAEAMLQEALAEVHRLQKDLRMLAEEAAGLAAAQKTALKVLCCCQSSVTIPISVDAFQSKLRYHICILAAHHLQFEIAFVVLIAKAEAEVCSSAIS